LAAQRRRRHYRSFEGEIRESPTEHRYGEPIVGVYAHGIQHDDGTIDDGTTDPVFKSPSISAQLRGAEGTTDSGITLSAEAFRKLADHLVMAADEADRWSQGNRIAVVAV
jgi:hypothetical protein